MRSLAPQHLRNSRSNRLYKNRFRLTIAEFCRLKTAIRTVSKSDQNRIFGHMLHKNTNSSSKINKNFGHPLCQMRLFPGHEFPLNVYPYKLPRVYLHK